MRVKKREFVLEFSQLSCPWSNENKSCMRVDEIMVHDRNDDNSSVQTKPTSCNIVGPTMLHEVGRNFKQV